MVAPKVAGSSPVGHPIQDADILLLATSLFLPVLTPGWPQPFRQTEISPQWRFRPWVWRSVRLVVMRHGDDDFSPSVPCFEIPDSFSRLS
jgi:hypothetical protein